MFFLEYKEYQYGCREYVSYKVEEFDSFEKAYKRAQEIKYDAIKNDVYSETSIISTEDLEK